MRITIAQRLRPFTHLAGSSFILPGSPFCLEIFPALIRVKDLSASTPVLLGNLALDVKGPVKNFTALLDLEKGILRVWGESKAGYFRYSIRACKEKNAFEIAIEKAPEKEFNVKYSGSLIGDKIPQDHSQAKWMFKSPLSFEKKDFSFFLPQLERLSLGSHKILDWQLVQRRLSFAEIFPVWHRLSQMVPDHSFTELTGTALLLHDCRQGIEAKAPEKILEQFTSLYLAGFKDLLSPQLTDTLHQGINCMGVSLSDPQNLPAEGTLSPLILLSEGAGLIRSLFIQEKDQTLHILPALPPEFHSGRFLEIKCAKQGVLSMEWTKKSIRRMTFSASENQSLAFSFFDREKKCRLRRSTKDKGISYAPNSQIDIQAGEEYWFDNFQR